MKVDVLKGATLLPRSKRAPSYVVSVGPNKSKRLTLNPFCPFDEYSHVLQYRVDEDTMILRRAPKRKLVSDRGRA